MEHTKDMSELKNTGYELFILLVSILSIFNLVVFILPGIDPLIKEVIFIIDMVLTLIFIGDFLYRFFTAESKTNYFFRNWGWADLLACIPAQQFKVFRFFRIFRVIRLLREFGLRNMLREVTDNRASSALYLTVFMVIFVLEFAGITIALAEVGKPGANIQTASDAVWWGFVTITTVGYGDQYPTTNTGRIVGIIVMFLGVGLFGVLTGFLANAFLSPGTEEESAAMVPAYPNRQLDEFRRLLNQQAKANRTLQSQLDAIQELLANQAVAIEPSVQESERINNH
jgi:voltage-gated potassium channel